jgi:hypothetical protein
MHCPPTGGKQESAELGMFDENLFTWLKKEHRIDPLIRCVRRVTAPATSETAMRRRVLLGQTSPLLVGAWISFGKAIEPVESMVHFIIRIRKYGYIERNRGRRH